MGTFSASGSNTAANLNAAAVSRNATTTNFTSIVNFAGSPFLPDVYEKQVHKFGNRSISGMLSKLAAEYPLQSDVINWTEQNRLHLRYDSITRTLGATANSFTFPANHGARVGQTVILSSGGTTGATQGIEGKGRIRSVSGTNGVTVVIDSYVAVVGTGTAADGGFANLGITAITAIVYGSEFAKGTTGMEGSLDVEYVDRTNRPIILKDKYSVSGSDVAQIGWIEVTDVNGDGGHGYLWYLQSELDQRARFMDYVETSMIEAVPAATGSPVALLSSTTSGNEFTAGGVNGTEGLFYALETYGNTFTAGFDDTSAATGRADFDRILLQLDNQGNIEENLLYLNREESLSIDNILAQQNSYGTGGTSYGMFNNSSDMALDLGFTGWRRGSYDFYKTDWKYLNDYVGRKAVSGAGTGTNSGASVQGIMVPAGSSSVYDEMLSSSIKRPMLHVRYRAAEGENRKLKNWVTGSVGGVYTSDADRMDVHYLSERALVTQAANNFIIFKNR